MKVYNIVGFNKLEKRVRELEAENKKLKADNEELRNIDNRNIWELEQKIKSLTAEKAELVEFVNNTNISKKDDGLWLSIKGGTKFATILLAGECGPIGKTAIENWQKIREELIAKLNKE